MLTVAFVNLDTVSPLLARTKNRQKLGDRTTGSKLNNDTLCIDAKHIQQVDFNYLII